MHAYNFSSFLSLEKNCPSFLHSSHLLGVIIVSFSHPILIVGYRHEFEEDNSVKEYIGNEGKLESKL